MGPREENPSAQLMWETKDAAGTNTALMSQILGGAGTALGAGG